MISFSAIIPAYKAVAYLGRAVQSCMAQTLPAKEVIVVLDGPDPEAKQILAQLRQPSLRVIELPENKGPSAARNAGWNAATGDFVAFLDADDEWLPTKLEQVAAAIAKVDAAVIFHDYQYPAHPSASRQGSTLTPIRSSRILLSNPTATCGLVVRSSIGIRYDDTMRYCEDHDLLLRLSALHIVYHLPQKLAVVHRLIGSIGGQSGNTKAMRAGERKMYKKYANQKGQWLWPPLWAFSKIKEWNKFFFK